MLTRCTIFPCWENFLILSQDRFWLGGAKSLYIFTSWKFRFFNITGFLTLISIRSIKPWSSLIAHERFTNPSAKSSWNFATNWPVYIHGACNRICRVARETRRGLISSQYLVRWDGTYVNESLTCVSHLISFHFFEMRCDEMRWNTLLLMGLFSLDLISYCNILADSYNIFISFSPHLISSHLKLIMRWDEIVSSHWKPFVVIMHYFFQSCVLACPSLGGRSNYFVIYLLK